MIYKRLMVKLDDVFESYSSIWLLGAYLRCEETPIA